ncbi:MAG TPA: O-methyltransferase [Acetobacteraceae bacterium]|nr:O-methyltransferase [Acetobacteraceae bacterium]
MGQDLWNTVDEYLVDRLIGDDPVLSAVLAANQAARLPSIDVSPAQGKLLHLLTRMMGARRVLEIGTLGGYSTIWIARALPADGLLVTLEAEPRHADVARENIRRANVRPRIDLRVGRALDTLPQLASENLPPFDLFFIDADKPSNPDYLAWALKLSRPGSVIVVDNVIRDGAIVDGASRNASVRGVRRMFEMIAQEPRLSATAIQTVGNKGWDGFAIAIVESG